MKKLILFIINFTWCLPQNMVGLILYQKHKHNQREKFHGSIITYHQGDWGGVSLGMFIFINGKKEQEWREKTKVHEYGHFLQSLILGPLYLLIIGLPSYIWCTNKKYIKLRETTGKSYFDFYPERWANYLGEKKTKMPAPK